jgi:hypothetical protein
MESNFASLNCTRMKTIWIEFKKKQIKFIKHSTLVLFPDGCKGNCLFVHVCILTNMPITLKLIFEEYIIH